MKVKDNWIESAIQAISSVHIADAQGIYESEYKGYISAFGAAIIQSGLLPAVIFYENSDGNQDKKLLVKAIVFILTSVGGYTIAPDQDFSQFVRLCQDKDTLLKNVNHAAVALKLALRTYKQNRND